MSFRDEDKEGDQVVNLVDPSNPNKKGIAMKEADILEDNDPERAVVLHDVGRCNQIQNRPTRKRINREDECVGGAVAVFRSE